jgi:DNA-binding IclR family transcriptional regulator
MTRVTVPVAPALARDAPHSPGVHTALSVLEALVGEAPLGLSDLAGRLLVPKSSLSRVCSVLIQRGWVTRDSAGRYDLGIRAIGLSAHATEYPLVRAFRAAAPDLVTRHNETVCLAVLDGDHSTFIAVDDSSHAVRLVTHVGSRTPAFASASGRVILADRAPHVVAAEYAGRPLVTPTGRRLRGVEELLEILETVRREGYAENREETANGLYAVSVPVRNAASAVLAALTVCVPTSRMRPARREQILQDLQAWGRRLSDGVAWLPAWNATQAEPSRVRAARPQRVEEIDREAHGSRSALSQG